MFYQTQSSSHRSNFLSSVVRLFFIFLTLVVVARCVKIPNAKDYSGLEAVVEAHNNNDANPNNPDHNDNHDDDDDADDDVDDKFVHDLAVKLKKDFSDDLVSDLFAMSYGLRKVARISELDKENRLFQFKFNDNDDDDDQNNMRRRRKKRSLDEVASVLDLLERDDRVEYVVPQKYLGRHKRGHQQYQRPQRERPNRGGGINLDFVSKHQLEQMLDELDESAETGQKLRESKSAAIDKLIDEIYEEMLGDDDDEDKEEQENENGRQVVEKRRKGDDVVHALDMIRKEIERKEAVQQLDVPEQIAFNDEQYAQQWYLINEGQLKIPLYHDLNVRQAWLNGYTGKNVTIVILDDGLDYEHPDFQGKYRPDLSYNLNDENDTRHDPMPSTFDNQNNHGTRCAGAAVAAANNSVCGVGIAYDAQIAAIKILDGPITDLLEARALSYKAPEVHIRSASWGPKDDGTRIEYPGRFVNMALEDGVKNGRNGKGTLFVWAAGNGGENDDDCSCDGYVSHWNIISIGSVNHRGLKPYFMETCPSTMAVVYSGGLTSKGTVDDEDDPGVRVVASDVRGKCTNTFQGTSSAAPLAAGALALVLEANPELTYRDVMHLITRTARIPNVEDTSGWIINGAKFHVNENYGFGVLDAAQMVQEAQTWKNVGKRERCEIVYPKKMPIEVEADQKLVLELEVRGDECSGEINSLEHVVANISFSFESRGDLKMTLVSPAHTPSEILSYRRNDVSSKSVRYFPFMTVFNWGESPRGLWKLVIEPRTRPTARRANLGTIDHFSLVLFGTKFEKNEGNNTSDQSGASNDASARKRFAVDSDTKMRAYRATDDDVLEIYNKELNLYRETRIINKRVLEAHPEFRDILKTLEPSEEKTSSSWKQP